MNPADNDHYDEQYYADNGQLADRPALRFYTQLVKRHMKPGRYLDFGCGTGHLVTHLEALGATDGFEVSTYSASTTRSSTGADVFESLEEIPESTYAGITAIHVFEHLENHVAERSAAAMRRALVPGGRALVVTPDLAGRAALKGGTGWMGFSDPTHINLKSHEQWHEFFVSHGFHIVREGSDGMWNVPYSNLPKHVDALRHAIPALSQFLSGRLWLKPGSGESAIFIIEANT